MYKFIQQIYCVYFLLSNVLCILVLLASYCYSGWLCQSLGYFQSTLHHSTFTMKNIKSSAESATIWLSVCVMLSCAAQGPKAVGVVRYPLSVHSDAWLPVCCGHAGRLMERRTGGRARSLKPQHSHFPSQSLTRSHPAQREGGR